MCCWDFFYHFLVVVIVLSSLRRLHAVFFNVIGEVVVVVFLFWCPLSIIRNCFCCTHWHHIDVCVCVCVNSERLFCFFPLILCNFSTLAQSDCDRSTFYCLFMWKSPPETRTVGRHTQWSQFNQKILGIVCLYTSIFIGKIYDGISLPDTFLMIFPWKENEPHEDAVAYLHIRMP